MKENKLYVPFLMAVFLLVFGKNDGFTQHPNDPSVILKDSMVSYENPMTYELMHIAIAITDNSIVSRGYNVHSLINDTTTNYYREVVRYFASFKNHELIGKLNKALSKNVIYYIPNLQLAYNYRYDNGYLKKEKKFPLMQRLFYQVRSVKPKIFKDFAKVTNFEKFYQEHQQYYTQVLSNSQKKANVNAQIKWLEHQFGRGYKKYHLVVSPLMNSTHFTKRFRYQGEKQCLMWVARYDERGTSEIDAAAYSGLVMTEIDHNYVNPESDKYRKELEEIMGKTHRNKWTSGVEGNFYKNGYKVFNEYMTHAAYLLYILDHYTPNEVVIIEQNKISAMEERRKFIKFGAFYHHLKQLYTTKKAGETLAYFYPQMIDWCKQQNKN